MKRAKVFVRVDASSRTGGGHLSRCLALADAFLERNCPVTFLCGEIDEQYEQLITRRGHEMKRLALGSPVSGHRREDGSWLRADAEASIKLISASSNAGKILIVDHYRIDRRWETALKFHVDCVFVIDDLADRTHDCRILLDQTYGGGAVRYKDLVPADCEGLFGPTYALLRPAFALMRKKQKRDDPDGDSFVVHVFFGSEDAAGNTQRFSRILMTLDKVREVRVAVSPWYRDTGLLQDLQAENAERFSWCIPDERMAEHMAGCDVAIGAPGQATWERACLGLPAAYIAISETQVPILRHLQSLGFCSFLGTDSEITDETFQSAVGRFLGDTPMLARMSKESTEAVDGLGAARAANAALSC